MLKRRSRAIFAATWLSAVLIGCGSDRAPTDAPRILTLPSQLTFACGDLRVPVEAFSNSLGVENGPGEPVVALRDFMRRGLPAGETGSDAPFRVLLEGADTVVFGSDIVGPEGIRIVLAERLDGQWSARGLGSCRPVLALPGLNAARWALAAGAAMPGPATNRVTALVSEVPCVSGRPADGRILPPAITRQATYVLVVFAIRPPEPNGLVEACPKAAPTSVEVDLGGPLGNREVLDGGVWPPAPVWHPECCG